MKQRDCFTEWYTKSDDKSNSLTKLWLHMYIDISSELTGNRPKVTLIHNNYCSASTVHVNRKL